MKAFLFSTSVLTLMIIAILCNSFYVKDATKEVKATLQTMQSCDIVQSRALQERWQNMQKKLELSISAADMAEVSNRLTELCTAAEFKNEEAFERARALCLDGITRIQDLERFSFLHIL
jgi:hypothetical protein